MTLKCMEGILHIMNSMLIVYVMPRHIVQNQHRWLILRYKSYGGKMADDPVRVGEHSNSGH